MNVSGESLASWCWWVAAWVFGVGAVACAAWGLWGDRRRGRRRCPRCWYNMHGISGMTCPECGQTVANEQGLHRARRRWRWAAAAVMLIVAAFQIHAQPRRRGQGWWRLAPTTVVALMGDWARMNPDPAWMVHSLLESGSVMIDRDDEAWEWQCELAERIASAQVSNAVADALVFRAVVPAGESFGIQLVDAASLAIQRHNRWLIMTSPLAPKQEAVVRLEAQLSWGERPVDMLNFLPKNLGENLVPLDLRMVEYVNGHARTVWRAHKDARVTVEGTLDQIVPPVRDATLDAAFRAAVVVLPDVEYAEDGTPSVQVYVEVDELRLSREHTSFDFTCELLLDGHVISKPDLLPNVMDVPAGEAMRRFLSGPPDSSGRPTIGDLKGWAVRITGDGGRRLADLRATQYWAGSLEIPLTDIRSKE